MIDVDCVLCFGYFLFSHERAVLSCLSKGRIIFSVCLLSPFADILFPEPSDVPRDSSFTAFDTVLAQATRQSYISVSTSHRNSSYEVQQHQTQQSQHLQQQQHFPGRANSVSSFSQPSATPPKIGSTSQSSSPYASSQVSSQVSVELRRNSSSVSDAGRAHVSDCHEARMHAGVLSENNIPCICI